MTIKTLPFLFLLLLISCGEDRSEEQPFAPIVTTGTPIVSASSVTLSGKVVASPNSTLSACGFVYGTAQQSLTSKVVMPTPSPDFTAVVDTLSAGTYYYSAYATNGIGTAYGDTLSFTIQ